VDHGSRVPKVWRLDKKVAGSGALGDLGAHVIDQSRYLAGEPSAVNGVLRTFIEKRPGGTVDVDDAFEATVEFENGAIGTYEATRFALGRKNQMRWEINGSKGRSSSTPSARTSSRSTSVTRSRASGRRASAQFSSPRRTTRTGSTGGRTGT